MKLLSFALMLCLSFQLNASSRNLQDLVDHHIYYVTIEWDQNDKEALENQTREFASALQKKIAAGEVTEQELETLVGAENIKELNLELQNEGLHKVLEKYTLERQMHGASWNGVKTGIVVGVLVALMIPVAYSIFIHKQLECDGPFDCHGGE